MPKKEKKKNMITLQGAYCEITNLIAQYIFLTQIWFG